MKKASVLIGSVFVLLMLGVRTAQGSLPGDISARWNGTPIHAPIATSLLISILIAVLFFVLTIRLTPRD
jgi:hypothetical protein